ncbi:MAG: DUF5618 family protein [Nitrospirae bacterium]|nr:DUF5618 family protein [Nitrospirota bacterium]
MRNGKALAERYFEEAVEYYLNSREFLRSCPVENDRYQKIKLVQEAFGTAWLAILKALRGALVQRGVLPKKLPKSFDSYAQAVQKHLAFRNGKLMQALDSAYHEIHISGYHGGDLVTTYTVKAAMETARRIIETVSGRRIV